MSTERWCSVWTYVTYDIAEKGNHLLHARTNVCMSEKAGFFLIKTHKYRGLLLELLRETTRPQHPYRGGLSSRPEATRIPVFISWSGSLK
jgi:hypothetical protein